MRTRPIKYRRVLTDRQVADACKLRGVNPNDGRRVILEVIPSAFGGRLLRYYTMRNVLGMIYGRWEIS
jgi:hypothetical protein